MKECEPMSVEETGDYDLIKIKMQDVTSLVLRKVIYMGTMRTKCLVVSKTSPSSLLVPTHPYELSSITQFPKILEYLMDFFLIT